MSGRKETVLDLAKFVDKGVQVKLTGGRQDDVIPVLDSSKYTTFGESNTTPRHFQESEQRSYQFEIFFTSLLSCSLAVAYGVMLLITRHIGGQDCELHKLQSFFLLIYSLFTVVGTLKGYDQLLNLVLDEAVEHLRDADDPLKTTDQKRSLGLIVCRGTAVMLVAPTDGTDEISNPFLQPDGA